MPGYDRTGPMGQGAMTGGGRGHCNANQNAVLGRGRGGVAFGCGRGRGFGGGGRGLRRIDAISDRESLEILKQQKEVLDQRIISLEKQTNETT